MVGETVSHYRIVEQLGAGGMGVVYKAEDTRLKRLVALKFLPPELTRDREAKERLVQEAQAASALDHPNICVIHEIDETPDGRLFLAMAYYEGETLKQRITAGRLSIDAALDIAIQVTEAIATAHEAGIVHRDIKPANIIVTRRGEAKLVDFGIAKLAGQSGLTKTGTTVGTIAYMSPEHIGGAEADERSDVWAIGVVLFEMLTAQLPFKGSHEASLMNSILNDKPQTLREARPEAPIELERVIARALAKNPAARHVSARQLVQELAALRLSRTATVAMAPVRSRSWRVIARPVVAIPAIVILLALGVVGVRAIERSRNVRWALETALPEIQRRVEQDDYAAALALAKKAERVLGSNAALAGLWNRLTITRSIQTTPQGARIWVRDASLKEDWELLGETPLENARLPRGILRWRIEKEGFETAEFIAGTGSPVGNLPASVELTATGSIPRGMVRIPADALALTLAGYNYNKTIKAGEFLMDRYEVTNVEFKEFVDAGGYEKREYWKHQFVENGRELSWAEAMVRFRDQTGRPGPSIWEVGTYSKGQEQHPVGGVSWYEAAAYAEFRGKSLPTLYHWVQAAGVPLAAYITPLSSIGGSGPSPVGHSRAVSRFGAFDMAGNVKEWCWNEMQPGATRYILGGAWNEPEYMFVYADARSPFDRSASHGFRCAYYPKAESVPPATTIAVERRARDYSVDKPASDEVFRVYKSLYAYDPAPLDPRIERTDDSAESWRKERVSFTGAAGQERMTAFLFLPKKAKPPYQALIYWPGSGVLRPISSDSLPGQTIDFLMVSGRAVLQPIYTGTYERYDGRGSSWPEMTRAYRDWVMKQVNEARRSLDYLGSRSDIRPDAIGYYGNSWGSRMGSIVLALDQRPRAAVFLSGGLASDEAPPEVDPLNFAPRVEVPVLMVNGHPDFIFEVERNQKPLFRFLGSPADRKRHVVYSGGHGIIFEKRSQVIRDTLDWLDRYLGLVQ